MAVSFTRTDLDRLLQMILDMESGTPNPNPHLAFGFRELAGTNNNQVPGQSTFGSADQPFPTVTQQYFQQVTVNVDGTPFDPNPGTAGDTLTTTYASTVPGAPQQFGVNVVDSAPRIISNLIADISKNNPAAVAVAQAFAAQLGDGYTAFNTNPSGFILPGADGEFGTADDQWGAGKDGIAGNDDDLWGPDGVLGGGDDLAPRDFNNLFIGNITPDAGLSAPFNSWMTFFGQFFDHGLDLISKGGNGYVYIPLAADDPLVTLGPDGKAGTGDELTDPSKRFMLLERASDVTILPGQDGILGTSDDIHQFTNQISPFVDQNQTYASDGSHNAFLREYMIGSDGTLHTTGRMLQHTTGGGAEAFFGDNPNTALDESLDDVRDGMATWADMKTNALRFGIILDDHDVRNVPVLATDAFGNLELTAAGRVQILVNVFDGVNTVAHKFALDPTAPLTLSGIAAAANTLFGGVSTKVLFTGHAFINDMARAASPFNDFGQALVADKDNAVGIPQVLNPNYDPTHVGPQTYLLELTQFVADNPNFDSGNPPSAINPQFLKLSQVYDNELLDAHYMAGDGRVNENIALTTVHEIFHEEHNRLVAQTKALIQAQLDAGDTAFASAWVLPGTVLTPGVAIAENAWNGERLMQVAKFGTETQYQHLVFEEFARKVAPTIHLFGNVDIHLDPAITSEFANAVYRFGHSMLDENVPLYQVNADGTMKIGLDGKPILNDMGLIQAFTNPLAFANLGNTGLAQIIQGTTHQIGSEIDEFVTGALRNNLLGLPLDLAALNIARGRDTGVAPLNLVRAQIFDATHDVTLKPYDNWAEFGLYLKHPESLVNFIAAYGTHASITITADLNAKRAAALDLITQGLNPANIGTDAWNFMHSLGNYANALHSAGADLKLHTSDDLFTTAGLDNPLAVHAAWSTGSITGLDNIDLWIGGLAEKQNLFGGLLGSTFNFIFETQLEALQDGDRLYYLPRIEGLDFGSQIENNTFADMIIANTGAKHIPASIFLTPEYTVEAKDVTNDPATWLKNPVTGAYLVEKLPDGTIRFIGDDNFFGNTMVLGGTDGNDRLQAGHADDDTVWGDGGDDWIDGGNGDDFLYGGTGNDTFVDSAGFDVIHGEQGNDSVFAGLGDDVVFGGDGDDYVEGGMGIDEVIGGAGNDILKGGEDDDELIGNEGDDWIEGGDGGDGLVGDTGAPTGMVPLFSANDVLIGGTNGDKMVGFSGDDIMLGLGGFDKFNGLLGFDWASFEQEVHGVSVDMDRREFVANPIAPAGDAIRDFFVETEALSGTAYNDFIQGTEDAGRAAGVFNELQNVNLIFNLDTFFRNGVAADWDATGNPIAGDNGFSDGNILLGGDGSDFITGRSGNDIIDGDAYLHVALSGNGGAGSQIIREIFWDTTEGDIDTAVFRDVIANYTINLTPDAEGFITVTHNGSVGGAVAGIRIAVNEGTDKIRNVERLQFADVTININPDPTANLPTTGTLLITDDDGDAATPINAIVGTALTVDLLNSNVSDPDNIQAGTVKYQWQQNIVTAGGGQAWVDIVGATGTTFTPTNANLGNPIRVVESYTDGKGLKESIASEETLLVVANPTPTVNTAPFIVGQQAPVGLPDTNARTGFPINLLLPLTTVFGDNETAANDLIFTATLANGQPLASVGLSFNLIPDLVNGGFSGATITGNVANPGQIAIKVIATDTGPGTALSVTDTFIINVQTGNLAPVISVAPESNTTLEDTAVVGFLNGPETPDPDGPAPTPVWRLVQGSAVNGTVSLDGNTGKYTFTPTVGLSSDDLVGPAPTFSFQYRLFDGATYSQVKTVTVNVDAFDNGKADVSISGVAAAGGTLSAVIGADPDGPWIFGTDTYQWFRDGVEIVGATSADLVLDPNGADNGHTFSVQAGYMDAQGFVYTTTVGSGPVSPATDPIGIIGARGISGGGTPSRIQAFNTLSDPDGGIQDGTVSYSWEVSSDGINFSPAVSGVSPDTLTFTPPLPPVGSGPVSGFVRLTITYIDAAGNLNTATGQPVRYIVDNAQTHTFSGTSFAELIFGNGGADQITANGGDDFVQGGGGADSFFATVNDGNDTYDGGAGNDTYVMTGTAGPSSADLTLGTATGPQTGTDTLVSIENITGSDGDNTLTGNNQANRLQGNGGNDRLDGGAAGADTLIGGQGNDTYVVSHAGMTLTEVAGQGTDTVESSITFSLATLAAIENLTLTGLGNINGTGNNGNNTITGNAGNNTLDAGNAGVDTMIGGDGNDTYVFNHATTTLTEANGTLGGIDTVQASLGNTSATLFTLAADFENLTLQGATALSGTGNGADNVLIGNTAANTLTGLGGNDRLDGGAAGADTLVGGDGDDTYVVSHAGMTLTEGAGALSGIDTVQTSVANGGLGSTTFTLAANFENLTLTGAAAINGTGNGDDNVITGNAAKNTLSGLGGVDTFIGSLGGDTYIGGAGNDTFVFNSALTAGFTTGVIATRSIISDFVHLADKINLTNIDAIVGGADDNFSFVGLVAGSGVLAAGQIGYFQSGGNTFIEGNIGGDPGAVDFQIQLTGLVTLTSDDFLGLV